MTQYESLRLHCKALRLPTIGQVSGDSIARAERESWSFEAFLMHLLEQELEGRRRRRIERLQNTPGGRYWSRINRNRSQRLVHSNLPLGRALVAGQA